MYGYIYKLLNVLTFTLFLWNAKENLVSYARVVNLKVHFNVIIVIQIKMDIVNSELA